MLYRCEDVLTTLDDRPELASIPVLGMTGSAVETDIVRSSGIDLDAYIQKPLDPDEFIDAIREREVFGLTIVRKSAEDTA